MKGVDESNPPAIPLFEKRKYRFPTEFTTITPLLCKDSETLPGIYYYCHNHHDI